MIDSQLRKQLAIKTWIIGILVLGFVVSVMVPKLAIARLGEVGYGTFALIVGFSGILAFADLGLIPGLIRGLARPIAIGDRAQVNANLRTIDRVVLGVSALLVTGCAGLMYWSLPVFRWNAFHALFAFAAATCFCISADIRSSMLRVSGAVEASYLLRALYQLTYLATVVVLYYSIKRWSGVWLLSYAQLGGSVIYYSSIKWYFKRKCSAVLPIRDEPLVVNTKSSFWSEAWRVSSPERLNRVIQLVTGAIERPLLIATAGLAMVTSYDLLMRLVLLVSAVPGALNDPLLAMLAHDSVRHSKERRFPMALRLTRIASGLCASVGVIVCLVLWTGFHTTLFHIPSRIPWGVGLLIAMVAAVNIQTASESAALMSEGVVQPMNTKLYVEAFGIVIAAIVAWWLRNGLLFIVIRYCAQGVSATGFLLWAGLQRW